MCAIAGMINVAADRQTRNKMLSTMQCRGPDENGSFEDGACCLLHSRLSIIDPKGGQQPMQLKLGNEVFTIVYNGELYNTVELQQLLSRLGHSFDGHSDTEVVLHAFAQWEEKCLERFNGIFAFAVWQHKRKKLFLARDRMGVKPLFYHLTEDGIVFASEIKTLLAHPQIPARLDREGVLQLIMLGPGRIPGSGVLKDIQELEPGCFGYHYCGKWNWKRYWKLKDREHTESFEQTAEQVRFLVTDAIKRQMVSDVPIGTFLSGGLDSSLISSVCAREMEKLGKQLPTFSVDYLNNERYFVPGKFQPDSDNRYIEIMNQYLKSEHHWSVLSTDSLVTFLDEATRARDLPGMADVDTSLLVFCGEIRKHVKVALSGECADEIFGGYPWYRDPEIRSADGFPWSQNVKERALFMHPEIRKSVDPIAFVHDIYRTAINRCDILPGTTRLERRMKELVNLNQYWFMQTLLDRKDRMSMHHGLEVRVPFCDYRIAEYLYGVPWQYKDHQGREKGLLRYAMADYLPQEVLHRKKSPYPKTFDPKYFQCVSERLRALLETEDAPIFDILDKKEIEKLLSTEQIWPWYGQLMRAPQTIAYMLQINCWLETYSVSIID